VCPLCHKGKILETFWSYRCTESKTCEFNVWKEKNQRYIDRSVMADILSSGKVGPLDFYANGGTSYTAWLGTAGTGIMLYDETGKAMETAPGAEVKVLGEYPVEQTFLGVPGKIIETETSYMCEFLGNDAAAAAAAKGSASEDAKPKKKTKAKPKADKPEKPKKAPKKKIARMPKVLCQYPVTLEQFRNYVVTGATPEILDFKSKKGRPFGASLHMKPDGSFEFKFVSRKKAMEAQGVVEQPKPKKPRAKGGKAKVVKKGAVGVAESVGT
jgi:hypothetical protein